jgi:hypothetical protein
MNFNATQSVCKFGDFSPAIAAAMQVMKTPKPLKIPVSSVVVCQRSSHVVRPTVRPMWE